MSVRLQRSFSSIRRMPSLSLRRATSVDSGENISTPRTDSNNNQSYNILLLGMLGVGKSALTVKYLTRRFINEYHPLLEGMYKKNDVVDGEGVTVQIYDTGCPLERAQTTWQHYSQHVLWADIVIVVFSIDNQQSFTFASDLVKASSIVPHGSVVLVGNKVDIEWKRQVDKEEIERLVSNYDIPYQETTSCCEYDTVSSVFHNAIRNARQISHERLFSSVSFDPSDTSSTRDLTPSNLHIPDDPFVFGSVESPQSSSPGSPSATPGSVSPGACEITEEALWNHNNNNKYETSSQRVLTRGKPHLVRMTSTPCFNQEVKYNEVSFSDDCLTNNKQNSSQFRGIKNTSALSKDKLQHNKKLRRNAGFSLFNNKFKIF